MSGNRPRALCIHPPYPSKLHLIRSFRNAGDASLVVAPRVFKCEALKLTIYIEASYGGLFAACLAVKGEADHGQFAVTS